MATVSQPKEEGTLKVFPNPTNNNIHIAYPNGVLPQKISISNAFGQEILEIAKPNNPEIVLPLHLTNGVYALTIFYENNASLSTQFVLLR